MKFTNRLMAIAAITALCAGFAACSDDDDNKKDDPNNPDSPTEQPGAVDPNLVFNQGMPTNVNGAAVSKDKEGRVTQIKGNGETVTFEYVNGSRAFDYNVIMTVKDDYNTRDYETLYIRLNAMGFAAEVQETESDSRDVETWRFSYDANGYLTKMYRSEGGGEETTLTWTAGNVTAVRKVEKNDRETDNCVITYGTDKNIGSVMLYDECLGVDMDEMAMAYYAGMLGKATVNLPVKNVEGLDTETFSWTLDANGYPSRMDATENGRPSQPIYFTW